MLSDFLHTERLELIDRCKAKASLRANAKPGTEPELQHGVPLFLDQLIRTLRMEATPADGTSVRLSGLSGAWRPIRSDLGEAAALHGRELFLRGYSVEAVVHDYGDVCQAVTELADERDVAIAVPEFHTLNRCLDNAIADAVKEYASMPMQQRTGSSSPCPTSAEGSRRKGWIRCSSRSSSAIRTGTGWAWACPYAASM